MLFPFTKYSSKSAPLVQITQLPGYIYCFDKRNNMTIRVVLLSMLLLPLAIHAQMGGNGGFGSRRTGAAGSGMGTYFPAGNVDGRVVDSANNPIKGASVILQQQDITSGGDKDASQALPYFKEITTKKNGKFSFGALRPFHHYKLSIMADGYRRLEKNINYATQPGRSAREVEDSLSMALPGRKLSSTGKDLGDLHLVKLPH